MCPIVGARYHKCKKKFESFKFSLINFLNNVQAILRNSSSFFRANDGFCTARDHKDNDGKHFIRRMWEESASNIIEHKKDTEKETFYHHDG